MDTSTAYSEDLRSMFARFGKIAMAIAFVVLICAFAIGSVQAAEHGGGHGGGGHGGGGDHRGGGGGDRDRGYHGGGYYGGGGHWGGGYYAPGPDIYVAPEPYVYAPAPCDYGQDYDGPEYYCTPPAPPGINLFFGL